MSVFRRRKAQTEVDEATFVDDLDEQDREYEDAELQAELEAREAEALRAARVVQRPEGPWDVADAPENELVRIDLGGLRVPVPPETEVRVDLGPDGEVVAATLVQGEGAVQVSAFAAPRSEGIWAEVAEEIAASLRASGGSATEQEGTFGPELAALVPTEVPGQGIMMQAARFAGVDGPRWFLRALFTGRAAVDAEVAAPLEAALRDVVVVRGSEPMAVRDPLPLRLPADLPRPDELDQQADTPAEPLPLERGPEITETR